MMAMKPFDAVSQKDGDGHVVSVTGELDMATAPALESCLKPLDGAVTLDCSGLTFMDSRGISLLVQTHLRLEEGGGRLTIAALPSSCRRVLEVMNLDEVLHLA